jgi:hypothetical protein
VAITAFVDADRQMFLQYLREAAERFEGAELRALRKLLDEVDRQHQWGGLKKKLTPEGHWLWLCEEHAQEYR